MRKIYRGVRSPTRITVIEEWPDGVKVTRALDHIIIHSPSGLEWGYGGSGPADLAFSILANHFEEPVEVPRACTRLSHEDRYPEASRYYQAFKWHAVATWDYEGWQITSDEIDAWLASLRQEWAAPGISE